jgi:hypothetical protein
MIGVELNKTRRCGVQGIVLVACIVILPITFICCSKAYIHLQEASARRSAKAVLVLPGLGMSRKGIRAAKQWYPNQGFDVFIPEYQTKQGFRGNVAALRAYVEQHRLETYEEVYAFVYLLGGWTLNRYLEQYPFFNLKKIVYDRSPYQEQAPRIVMENMPWLIGKLFGTTVAELRDTPYPTLEKGDRQIGIIVECKASFYIRWNREQLCPISDRDWSPAAFRQPHDDLIYTFLDHYEMYHRFDVIGEELLSFFNTGRFTQSASRVRIDRDPFE